MHFYKLTKQGISLALGSGKQSSNDSRIQESGSEDLQLVCTKALAHTTYSCYSFTAASMMYRKDEM